MIQIRPKKLPEKGSIIKLSEIQREINAEATHELSVKKADDLWETRTNNAAFRDIRDCLKEMSPGVERCNYCEDSAGNDIEHFKPKAHFPEFAFVWDNYLLACSICNSNYKRSRFGLFDPKSGKTIELEKSRTRPPSGDILLINPRGIDNPLEFMRVDLLTGVISSLDPANPDKDRRAKYTTEILSLSRAELTVARRKAYQHYRNRVKCYVDTKNNNPKDPSLEIQKKELLTDNHPTVWMEILRYYREGWLQNNDPELDSWFAKNQELSTWIP